MRAVRKGKRVSRHSTRRGIKLAGFGGWFQDETLHDRLINRLERAEEDAVKLIGYRQRAGAHGLLWLT